MLTDFDAYCDESYLSETYRTIACLSLPSKKEPALTACIRAALARSGVREFKWSRCTDARFRFAAERLIDHAFEAVGSLGLRVLVLLWDIEDRRHKIIGRDDPANFDRLFYRVLKTTMDARQSGAVWRVFCDQKDGVKWPVIHDCVQAIGLHEPADALHLFQRPVRQHYAVVALAEVESQAVPLVQLADLFAGAVGYSRNYFDKYVKWRDGAQAHLLSIRLEGAPAERRLSGADDVRCRLLQRIHARAEEGGYWVSLDSSGGLRTRRPSSPMNFWWYEPQTEEDKAPRR